MKKEYYAKCGLQAPATCGKQIFLRTIDGFSPLIAKSKRFCSAGGVIEGVTESYVCPYAQIRELVDAQMDS